MSTNGKANGNGNGRHKLSDEEFGRLVRKAKKLNRYADELDDEPGSGNSADKFRDRARRLALKAVLSL